MTQKVAYILRTRWGSAGEDRNIRAIAESVRHCFDKFFEHFNSRAISEPRSCCLFCCAVTVLMLETEQ